MVQRGRRIGDYGVIGDGRSMALVSRNGSIDWLCWPRFDSPPLFDRLLDEERGSAFRFGPAAAAGIDTTWRYVDETAILETCHRTAAGELVVTDFMPALPEEEKAARLLPEQALLRVARCVAGEVDLEVDLDVGSRMAAALGLSPFRVVAQGALGVRLERPGELLVLRGELPLRAEGPGRVVGRRRLRAGEQVRLALGRAEEGPAVLPPLAEGDASVDRLLAATARSWRTWARQARYDGPMRELVVRSALTLKLLQYAPSGAIVAAPTTSLPERLGGPLNWDYRFCWLRDAALTAHALFGLGYLDEGRAFVSWLLHATRLDQPRLRVLYDVFGRQPAPERTVDVAGFQGSRPVRVGNAADAQLQLDVYGEVVQATAELVQHDAAAGAHLDGDTRRMLARVGAWLCAHAEEADAGIWEDRGPGRPWTHGRAMAFAALDGLLTLGDAGVLPRLPVEELRAGRSRLARAVLEGGFHDGLGTFTALLGGDTVDASLLLLPLTGIVAAADPRMRGTIARIEERLGAGPGRVYRSEWSPGREGAFVACGFWLVDALARAGDLEGAQAEFAGAAACANDLGLFSEEVDPGDGTLLGNFPQGFSHVGLIHAALTLERLERLGRLERRERATRVSTSRDAARPVPP